MFLSNLLKKIISVFQYRHRMSNAAHDIEFKALSVMPLYNYNHNNQCRCLYKQNWKLSYRIY